MSRETYSFNNDEDGQTCIANMYSLAYELLVRANEISDDIDSGFDVLMKAKHEFKESLKDFGGKILTILISLSRLLLGRDIN